MIYECIFYNNVYLLAKQDGWKWSSKELEAPFSIHKTESLEPAAEDYEVEVNGQTIMASEIDGSLIDG